MMVTLLMIRCRRGSHCDQIIVEDHSNEQDTGSMGDDTTTPPETGTKENVCRGRRNTTLKMIVTALWQLLLLLFFSVVPLIHYVL
jgi:hypothetical protein